MFVLVFVPGLSSVLYSFNKIKQLSYFYNNGLTRLK